MLATYIGAPVSRANLDTWVNSGNLPVTTVRDPDRDPKQTINALVRREYAYVIDLQTMKIVQIRIGSVTGSGDSAVYTAIQDMLTLLGAKGG